MVKILCDTPKITAIQYYNAEINRTFITVFANNTHQKSVTLYPEIDENSDYKFGDEILRGKDILEQGLTLEIDTGYTASLAELKKI